MNTWFSFRNAASQSEPAEISIHDEIGSWGVSAKDFLAQLARIPSGTAIRLSLHSPGGDVFDGLAIYNALKARGDVTVRIQGLAASMGSVIAMAGKRIEMPKNAWLMIHNPTGLAYGEAGDMRELANLLDKLKGSLVSTYVERTGLKAEEVSALMDAVTWLNGDDAKAQGFVDVVTEEVALSANAFQGSRSLMNAGRVPTALFDTSPPEKRDAPANPNPSEDPMNKMIVALCGLVGLTLKGDETEDQVVDLVKNHKPKAPDAVLNLEDAETKKVFDAAVAEGVKAALPKALEEAQRPMVKQITDLEALIKNGAAGSANAGAPVPGAGGGGGKSKDEQITDLQEQLGKCKDTKERGRITAEISKLRQS